jgi:hypothetical protein
MIEDGLLCPMMVLFAFFGEYGKHIVMLNFSALISHLYSPVSCLFIMPKALLLLEMVCEANLQHSSGLRFWYTIDGTGECEAWCKVRGSVTSTANKLDLLL